MDNRNTNINPEIVTPKETCPFFTLAFLDKMAHFNRERIPERIVHAKGAGAFGYFHCYRSMAHYTLADFLQKSNVKTNVFVRFSTVAGSKGSADTLRDTRGFAVKFYTSQGVYDIVGNNFPVFLLRDPNRFPDLVHSIRPAPNTNIPDPRRFWDFVSMVPETIHMLTWLYSDRGTIDDYRNMDGYSINTFVWLNAAGKRTYIRYQFKTRQGIKTITREEAKLLAGKTPDICIQNLYQAIALGNSPKWDVCVQLLPPELADTLDFDPLDTTKLWPEEKFPLIPIGLLCLNQNPENFFAQVEQAAFCPGNLVPGIELSSDRLLQARAFAYHDTQRYRLGSNFSMLPVNRPPVPVANNMRDGAATYLFNPEPINYSPNSLNKNLPRENCMPGPQAASLPSSSTRQEGDDFKQAGEHYLSMSHIEKEHLIDNIAVELTLCNDDIVSRVLSYFSSANEEFGKRLRERIHFYRKSNI